MIEDEVQRQEQQKQLTLGQLVSLLESYEIWHPGEKINGFSSAHSDRGYNEQIAFSPESNVTVESMLDNAKQAIGKRFDGYLMTEKTLCNIAEYRECGRILNKETLSAMCCNNPLPDPIED